MADDGQRGWGMVNGVEAGSTRSREDQCGLGRINEVEVGGIIVVEIKKKTGQRQCHGFRATADHVACKSCVQEGTASSGASVECNGLPAPPLPKLLDRPRMNRQFWTHFMCTRVILMISITPSLAKPSCCLERAARLQGKASGDGSFGDLHMSF